MKPSQIVAGYLSIQASGTAAWWALLWWFPGSVAWFQPNHWPDQTLLSFWLADGVLLVGGSLVVSFAVAAEKPWASTAVWMLAATVWYPTLYCVAVSIVTDQAWIASAMMVSMAGLTLAMATIQGSGEQSPDTIRVTPMKPAAAIAWTLIQTAIFWSVFLWILPRGIVELESRIGLPSFHSPWQGIVAIALFILASMLGLWSGLTMARRGDGTPLPTATAPKLVVDGPYRFVRNPMAVAGILQGIAVGYYLGSSTVIVYAIAGGFVWHLFVRPVEEADLHHRFGKRYLQYKETVGLWIPRLRPFKPSAAR